MLFVHIYMICTCVYYMCADIYIYGIQKYDFSQMNRLDVHNMYMHVYLIHKCQQTRKRRAQSM